MPLTRWRRTDQSRRRERPARTPRRERRQDHDPPAQKFARWAEQYLRLGIAPTPELAKVFARFKQWLTQIYQTLKGLGTPINEDVRGVFDRLLTTEPRPRPLRRRPPTSPNGSVSSIATAMHPASRRPISTP